MLGDRASWRRVRLSAGWVEGGGRAPQIKPSRICSRRLIRSTVRPLDVLPCSRTDTTHLVVRAGRRPSSARLTGNLAESKTTKLIRSGFLTPWSVRDHGEAEKAGLLPNHGEGGGVSGTTDAERGSNNPPTAPATRDQHSTT